MSKYTGYNLADIRDLETLLAALAECGYAEGKVEVHATPQLLYDWQGRSTQYLDGTNPDRAEVIIRRRNTGLGASNDIGFQKQQDGSYRAIVSQYDQSLQIKRVPFVDAVKNAYAKLNCDKTVQQVLANTVKLKLRGLIPQHATLVKQETADEIKFSVRY